MADNVDRRDFLRHAGAMGAALGTVRTALGRSSDKSNGRVIGANDRINVGVIGVGGRGTDDLKNFTKYGTENNACQVIAVADCYQKRINRAKELLKINDGYLDYREILNRQDIDVVVVATPDHWHARIALEAMDHGKDVYLEKPMCHSIDEARQLVNTVKETGRVLQVGSQTTSADQWWKASGTGRSTRERGRRRRARITSTGKCGWGRRPSVLSTRIVSSDSVNIGIIPAELRRIFFITWWRR